MSQYPVHRICADLHHRTNMFEMDAKFYLHQLAELRQSGFDPGTTPMRQLAVDAKALRDLVDAIDAQRNELTKQTELT
jgi:hypothetical protein